MTDTLTLPDPDADQPSGGFSFAYTPYSEELVAGVYVLRARRLYRERFYECSLVFATPLDNPEDGVVVARWGTQRDGRSNGVSAIVNRRDIFIGGCGRGTISWTSTKLGHNMTGLIPSGTNRMPPLGGSIWVDFQERDR